MDDPLERAYLQWLSDQVGSLNGNPRSSHVEFLHQLFTKEFFWIVANDDNRVDDAIALRYEFVDNYWHGRVPHGWFEMGVSFLEVMIGIARRLAWQTDGEPSEQFWILTQEIGAHPCTDANYRRSPTQMRNRVDAIMNRIIWRTYHPNGKGGFFPLDHAHQDQRHVEIWYQMNAYLRERD